MDYRYKYELIDIDDFIIISQANGVCLVPVHWYPPLVDNCKYAIII